MIGCGFVVHDEVGNIIAARIGGLQGPMTALDAESLSCRAALQIYNGCFGKFSVEERGKKEKLKAGGRDLNLGSGRTFVTLIKQCN